MLDHNVHVRAAALLCNAERDCAPIEPLTELFPGLDVVDAYQIQLANIGRKRARGARVVGHKVGLSSLAMQRMMGVDEPDYGHLLDVMALRESVPIAVEDYCWPRIEVEVGFVLGTGLPGADCTEQDVLDATEAVVPSIELIDSRIRDWRIGLADTIADNASSAGFVLGEARVPPTEVDLRGIDAVLYRNGGEEIVSGRSDAVLGNPVTVVAWLARKVAAFGVRLQAGHVVLPGSCARAVDVRAGETYRADFTGLGSVSLSFK